MKLVLSASIELDGVSRTTRFAAIAASATAALVAFASLAGIVVPAIYARETATWRLQAVAQDWVNLVVDVPWLVAAAILALRGSRRARLLLGGALVYTAYSYAIYAFDVHFNALFLVYCAALGLPVYALVALAPDLRDASTWFARRPPRRLAGGLAMAGASVFALLWLSQIVPALLHGTVPDEVAAAGVMTNPVHVLDLSLVLPAMFAAGWLLWHDRALGYAAVPVLLGFAVLMGVAVAAMMIALAAPVVACVAFVAFLAIVAVVLAKMLFTAEVQS
jgi:hypothetical protein